MSLNIYKTVIAGLTLVCATVLLVVGAISEAAGMSTITAVLGYILGNGVQARKGEPPAPLFYPKKVDDQQDKAA